MVTSLSTLIWLPILSAVIILVLGDRRPKFSEWLSLAVMVITLLISIQLFQRFGGGPDAALFQFEERVVWIASLNVYYHLAIDGISLALILMTAVVGVLVSAASIGIIHSRVAQYHACFLALQGLMIGVFCARDALLFYVFFEAMLLPMFLLIGTWGGPRRVYATLKFFLYTFFGSVFMLAALIKLYAIAGSFALDDLYAARISADTQFWMFLAFLIAFAVKVPMWPVHTWLPDAHVEAPTAGSMVLAAVMLKIGGYGFIRFSMPILPDASHELAWLLIALSLVAIVYVGFVALVQADMKKLVAYSSVAHMGFVSLGLFIAVPLMRSGSSSPAQLGVEGAMVQMISHGFISAAMFYCIGVLYERQHSRMIADYGGVAHRMPWFAMFAVFFAMANAGLPGTSGFIGEFLVILSAIQLDLGTAALASLTLVLGAAYSLWMVKRVYYGAVNPHTGVSKLEDISGRETLILSILAALVLLIGVYPAPLLDLMRPGVLALLAAATESKLPLPLF